MAEKPRTKRSVPERAEKDRGSAVLSKPLVVEVRETKGIKNPEQREIIEKANRKRKAIAKPIDDDFKRKVLKLAPDEPLPKEIVPTRGRSYHTPSTESRLRVAQYMAFGMTINTICRLENISEITLKEHYSHELEVGHDYINFLVANSLMQQALAGNITAQIFYLKTRGRGAFDDIQHHVHEMKSPETEAAKSKLLGFDAVEGEAKEV